MLKRSRKVALRAVCVMMFAIVEPSFANGGVQPVSPAAVSGKPDIEGAVVDVDSIGSVLAGGVLGALLGAGAVVVTGGGSVK